MIIPDFLAIGHITLDLGPRESNLGGAAVYAGLTARNLGQQVGIVTSVGGDFQQWDIFQGIQIHHRLSPVTTTFRNFYQGGIRQQEIFARAKVIRSSWIPSGWQKSKIVLLCPVANEVDGKIIKMFPNSLIGISPQGWFRTWDKKGRISYRPWKNYPEILPAGDVLIYSDEDLPYPQEAAREFGRFINIVIITQGTRGSTVYQGNQSYFIPPFPTVEVEPTGAGDVYAAAFLIKYYQTSKIIEAAQFASVVASFIVEKPGISGIPRPEEIMQRWHQYLQRYSQY